MMLLQQDDVTICNFIYLISF